MDWQVNSINFNLLIRQLLHDKDPEKRAEAARQLGFLQDGRAVNLLCRSLKTEIDPIVINRVIEALGRIADGRATLSIIGKLEDEIKKPENEKDKLRVIFIIESLIKIKDKRALESISYFLNSSDDKLLELAENAFNIILPSWRQVIAKERKVRSIRDIFKTSL